MVPSRNHSHVARKRRLRLRRNPARTARRAIPAADLHTAHPVGKPQFATFQAQQNDTAQVRLKLAPYQKRTGKNSRPVNPLEAGVG